MQVLREEHKISLEDIMQFPAWEFAFDEMKRDGLSGRTMRPCDSAPPYDIHQNRIYARATFELANGIRMKGLVTPIDVLSKFIVPILPADLLPTILTEHGRIYFWYGANRPSKKEIKENYRRLGVNPSDVFPITVTCDVETVNSLADGILQGFLYADIKKETAFYEIEEGDVRIIV